MTPALFYVPEAYSTGGAKLMGRNAAGESFLRGFLAHSRSSEFVAVVHEPANGAVFSAAVRAAGRQEPVQVIDWPGIGALAGRGPLFHPDPGLAPYAWQRAMHGHGAWSLTGITHTLSSHWAMDAVVNLLAAPVQPWDAVICTSRAGQRVVAELLQRQADYLRDRFKAQQIVLPQLPLIPLGIHTQDFQFSAAQRIAARTSVGADADTLVVLFAGRLSFHAKAHPLAMYQAIEQAARDLPAGQRILLVEFGQYASEPGARAFAEAARLACPTVTVRQLDGRQPENRAIAWACADVFCSLADNFQETFGITPLEAMAAGLPVVVSDWDGYRDTVRDGSDGFRIPTLMPQPGLGRDLAWRHASGADNFDRYCGHTCALIAVDVGAAARAFSRLFASAELRARMGAAGRQRACESFDWATIIPRYESLWESQEELRKGQAGSVRRLANPCPARMDPFRTFAGYTTQTLTPATLLALVGSDATTSAQRVAELRKLAMVGYAERILPSEDEIRWVLARAVTGPRPAAELVQGIPESRRAAVFRSLAWLTKLGVLTAAETSPGGGAVPLETS